MTLLTDPGQHRLGKIPKSRISSNHRISALFGTKSRQPWQGAWW